MFEFKCNLNSLLLFIYFSTLNVPVAFDLMDQKPSWVAETVWHSGYCPFPNVVLLARLR